MAKVRYLAGPGSEREVYEQEAQDNLQLPYDLHIIVKLDDLGVTDDTVLVHLLSLLYCIFLLKPWMFTAETLLCSSLESDESIRKAETSPLWWKW